MEAGTTTLNNQITMKNAGREEVESQKTMPVIMAKMRVKTNESDNQQKKEPQQSIPPSSSFEHQQMLLAQSAKQNEKLKPSLHCLFCQRELQLHPSLVTEGGEIAPISEGDAEGNLLPTGSSTVQKEVAIAETNVLTPLKVEPTQINKGLSEPDQQSVMSPESAHMSMCQSTNGNSNLLELIGKSSSPLDVPMCKKCATSMADELQAELGELERECHQYKQSLDQLLKRRADSPFDQDAARRKLEMLKAEERELQEQLAFLEDEERILNGELQTKIEERRKITEKDEQLYKKLRDNHRTLIEQADEQRSLKQQIRHAEEQIRRLSRTNVMDMCFYIWVDGEFGTISGFRLGRLRHETVEWNEVNAALGQMAFLLKVISERLGMDFVGFEVVPAGNCSFIRTQKKQQQSSSSGGGRIEELPLYGSGGWRPFGQPALDKALVAFMECFIQVEQHLKQYFPAGTQLLPYRMLKDKIIDKDSQYLVKMQLNSEERWTKAMKCLLLNLKRVIGILTTLPSLTAQQQPDSRAPTSIGDAGNRNIIPSTYSSSPSPSSIASGVSSSPATVTDKTPPINK